MSSNLIKYNYVNYDKEEKIIIDSDSKLPYFKPLSFDHLEVLNVDQNTVAEEGLDNFVPGLQAMPVSQIEQVDMEAIKKEADEILEKAKIEAADIVHAAQVESNQIVEEAKKDGYQQGYEDGKAEIGKLQEDLKKQIQDNAKEQQKFLQSIEPQYTSILIKLLEKLTGVVSSEYKSVILHLIQKALDDNTNDENYCIRVSREDYEYVKTKVDAIKAMLKENAIVEVVIDNKLEKSQCFIETDTSVIDCSLNAQLENLVTDLRMLAGI
ncbi:FliH/SctL family protein [Anaerosporobacter faecicola]|uniref:FliH/SctL family protein n=1 Tax=Anaerosporobacter faecicola TaxID=2718714 RepID=UPI0014389E80|nr:FliH/SctL family protein [Anaerosporobacter faecicola]